MNGLRWGAQIFVASSEEAEPIEEIVVVRTLYRASNIIESRQLHRRCHR